MRQGQELTTAEPSPKFVINFVFVSASLRAQCNLIITESSHRKSGSGLHFYTSQLYRNQDDWSLITAPCRSTHWSGKRNS